MFTIMTTNNNTSKYKKVSIPKELEWYHEQGISIIPLEPQTDSKKPVIKFKERTEKSTREEIAEWSKETDRWAIVCGEISGNLVVIDVDKEELFAGLNLGVVAAKTHTEEKKGKYHIFLRTPKPIKHKQLKFGDKEDISLRFNDNLIIAGGTAHPSGGAYQHFTTSPKKIATVESGFFDDLERLWLDYRGLTKEGKNSFAKLKKGITLKTNILDVIKSYTELKELKDNGDTYTCRCPLPKHKDLTPSFTIYKKTNSYYCWGCNKGGNPVTFVKDFFGGSNKEAITRLVDAGKIEEEGKELSIEDVKELEDYEANHIISNFVVYHKINNGKAEDFYVKVYCNDGEIKEEVVTPSSVPLETAPSVDFYEKEYGSLKRVFNELRGTQMDYTSFKDDIYSILTATGSMVSYFREIFYTFPYFDFTSPEVECGKTTAMKTMIFTSFYGTITASFSEPVMFREIDATHCAYGLDNIERLFTKPKDYVPIIDWLASSYSRDIPCKRLEKEGDNWIVKYFDGYGIKAFTHVKEFPYQFRALKSRTIQILMQKGNPKKFYPTPDKFVDIRDKLYHARLREHEKVKEVYEKLVASNILTGRAGDLYYPLLTIAQLVDEKENGVIFKKILDFAQKEKQEREEFDVWNKVLVNTIYEEGFYGSVSSQDIKPIFVDNLESEGLIKVDVKITTQSVSSRLKKLGFERDIKKKTERKTWFTVDAKLVDDKCYEYGIKDISLHNTPPNAHFSHFSHFSDENSLLNTEGEKSDERIEEGERGLEKPVLGVRKVVESEKSEKSEQKGGYDDEETKKKHDYDENYNNINNIKNVTQNNTNTNRKYSENLENKIVSRIKNISNIDARGANIEVVINHIAIDTGYKKEEVKEEINKMLREGKLLKPSQDEYGEYVRVVECHPKKKKKPTRFVNAKDDLDEDGNVIKKPNPEAPSEEKIKSDIESAKRSLEELGLRESRDKEDSDSDEDNEKVVSKAITEILQDDPDFLIRDDEDHFFTVRSKLGENDVEVDNATIVKVLEREKGANGGVVG